MRTERAGFEPAIGFKPNTAFPVLLLRPLGHLSGAAPPGRRAEDSTGPNRRILPVGGRTSRVVGWARPERDGLEAARAGGGIRRRGRGLPGEHQRLQAL